MNYLNKIENLIEDHIVEIKRYEYHANQNLVETYFNIGKLLVEAQGGENRAKYGNGLIKEYSIVLTKKYGKGFDISNLKRMRTFYITFQKGGAVRHQLTWTHYRSILSIKNENKRNYYINITIQNRLSYRELKQEIKNNSFERLSYANKSNIKLINNSGETRIEDIIKDPILISLGKNIGKNLSEKLLKKCILDDIEKFIMELGWGFYYGGSEKKIKVGDIYKCIDLEFFNTKFNCYVLIELKLEKLNIRDIGQIEFYIKYYDDNIKEIYHKKTIGIIVCKKKDILIEDTFKNEQIKVTTYKINV